jgi:outer membrane protein assembly factor BamB
VLNHVSRRLGALLAVSAILVAACGSGGSTAGGSPGVPGSGAAMGGGPVSTSGGPVSTSGGAPAGPAELGGGLAQVAPSSSIFPNGLLIADRGNGRLIVVNDQKQILWSFPVAGSFATPTPFNADDAFFSPDGKTIVANDEGRNVIYRIDIATRRVIWSYGHRGVRGSAAGYLDTPDDSYPLANGDIVVADINNCRVVEIAPTKQVVRQWGRTGICRTHAPYTYGAPNGDTPLPDGGLLVTQIHGSRVERLSATGQVLWDIHVPIVYPSDAQLDANGNVVVAGFTNPGVVICLAPSGKVLWRYEPTSGPGRLNHPSLATPLPNGLVAINDDDRNRMIVLDPRTMTIVWQYGTTDRAGATPGRLFDPDGHEPVPANVTL